MASQTLADYLEERIAAIGETKTHLSETLGWGPSYISNIVNGQFKPSKERCMILARVFGDDPNIILGLAGFYVQHEFTEDEQDLLQTYRSISARYKRDARKYLAYLKYLQDSEKPEALGDE